MTNFLNYKYYYQFCVFRLLRFEIRFAIWRKRFEILDKNYDWDSRLGFEIQILMAKYSIFCHCDSILGLSITAAECRPPKKLSISRALRFSFTHACRSWGWLLFFCTIKLWTIKVRIYTCTTYIQNVILKAYSRSTPYRRIIRQVHACDIRPSLFWKWLIV